MDAVTKSDEVWPDQPNPVVSITNDEWIKARDGVIFGDITPEQAAINMQTAVSKALDELLQG